MQLPSAKPRDAWRDELLHLRLRDAAVRLERHPLELVQRMGLILLGRWRVERLVVGTAVVLPDR